MLEPKHIARIGEGEYPETVRELADKWGEIFGISPSWIVSHAWVESTNHLRGPRAHNESGGAWGVMQMKVPTAENVVARLKKKLKATPELPSAAIVRRVLKTWHGKGEDLFNPELAVMLATYYLRLISNRLGTEDQHTVAAAYNQGPGAMEAALKHGEMTEAMKHYISKIEEAKEKGFA